MTRPNRERAMRRTALVAVAVTVDAQHPKSSAIHNSRADYPIFGVRIDRFSRAALCRSLPRKRPCGPPVVSVAKCQSRPKCAAAKLPQFTCLIANRSCIDLTSAWTSNRDCTVPRSGLAPALISKSIRWQLSAPHLLRCGGSRDNPCSTAGRRARVGGHRPAGRARTAQALARPFHRG